MKLFPAVLLSALLAVIAYHSFLLGRKNIKIFVRGAEYTVFILYYHLFLYTVFAAAFRLPYPEKLLFSHFSTSGTDFAGNVLCLAGVIGYALSASALRESYRIGIDENTGGPLTVSGVYRLSRNPLYISLLSLYLGLFLVYANAALLANLLLSAAVIHFQVQREEKFLRRHYGKVYLEYCGKVRRYF
jgi:protein-S-isoprenylcysteine O-methyltransferase Ste14